MKKDSKIALGLSLFIIFTVTFDLGVSYFYYLHGDTDYFIENEENRYIVNSWEQNEFPIMFFIKIPFYILCIVAGTWGFMSIKDKLKKYKSLYRNINFAYGSFVFAFIFLGIANLTAGLTWYDGEMNVMSFIYFSTYYNFLIFLVITGAIMCLVVAKSFVIYYKEKKQQKDVI